MIPPITISDEPHAIEIIDALKNLTYIDDRLRKSFKEFYGNPNQQNAVCGVS